MMRISGRIYCILVILFFVRCILARKFFTVTDDSNSFRNIRNSAQLGTGEYVAAGKSVIKINSSYGVEAKKINTTGPFVDVKRTIDGGLIFTSFGGELLKQDVAGNIIWSKKIVGDFGHCLKSVVSLSDGTFVGCGVKSVFMGSSDAMVVKIASNGDFIWGRSLRPPYSSCLDVVVDEDEGSIFSTGYVPLSSVDHGFLWKLNGTTGDTIWIKQIGDEAGVTQFRSVVKTSDGGLFAVGETTVPSWTMHGSTDKNIMVVKLNSSGGIEWSRVMGYTSVEEGEGHSTIQTSDGNYVVGGGFVLIGSVVFKLDTAGVLMWVKKMLLLPDEEDSFALRVTEDLDGSSIFVSGNENSAFGYLSLIGADGTGCGWSDWLEYETKILTISSSALTPILTTLPYSTEDCMLQYSEDTDAVNLFCEACPAYYYGDQCGVFKCGDRYLSNETGHCSGEGTCDVPGGHCRCNQYYYGEDCAVFECGDRYLSNETGHCSGEGTCDVPGGHCRCNQYYHGEDCAVFECDGFLSNETACYGHGTCDEVNGKCTCIPDYDTVKCKDLKPVPHPGDGDVGVAEEIKVVSFVVGLFSFLVWT